MGRHPKPYTVPEVASLFDHLFGAGQKGGWEQYDKCRKKMFEPLVWASCHQDFVARRPDGSVRGVTLILEIDRVDDVTADEDPIVSAVRRSLSQSLLRSDGVSLMSRFTIPEGDRREARPTMDALQICHLMHWATEQDLHLWIIVAHHPDHFAPLLAEMHFECMLGCDQTVGGMPVGCFVHDWKSEPWLVWRDRRKEVVVALC
jgi:hypothetical protein